MIWIKNYLKSRFGKVFINKYQSYYLNKYIKMSDTSDERMTELSKKIGICNKNVKALIEMVKTLTEKIEKPVEKSPDVKLASEFNELRDEKERIDEFFKKKQIGRPAGDYDSKRIQYHKMLMDGKIKEPKEATLIYYKIFRDMSNKTYILLD